MALHFEYNEKNDILAITRNSGGYLYYTDESPSGLLYHYTLSTNRPIGMDILNYKSYWKNRVFELITELVTFFSVDDYPTIPNLETKLRLELEKIT